MEPSMFTFEQIKELIELVARYRLQGVEIERSGMRLKLSGELASAAVETAPAPSSAAAPAAPSQPAAPAADASTAGPSSPPSGPAASAAAPHVVASPIVGTFYTAPSPDSEPFVRIGDRVSKGQVLCIVEAMKLMNEIESDADGVVTEIYPKNAQPVEYGEPLFGIRAD